MKLNLDYLLEMLWEYLALTCIYTKKRGRKLRTTAQKWLNLPQLSQGYQPAVPPRGPRARLLEQRNLA